MPKPNVIVDRVKSLDHPNRPLVAAQGTGVPGFVVVHLAGAASLLDLNEPRAIVWEGVLDELRLANEPVYLETDPHTNVIKQVLYPRSVVVTAIAAAPVGNLHEVELEISQARHYLNTTNPDYQQLLNALTAARQQRLQVLVTETLDGHEIIDVRPGAAPFAVGPAWFEWYVEQIEHHSVIAPGGSEGPFYCPCCSCRTLDERGGFEICPVCFWEDDGQDDHDADMVRGGPNGVLSLTQARANYKTFGACEERFVGNVRQPRREELPRQ